MSSKKRSEIRGDRKSALLGTLAGWSMKLMAATLRLEVRDLCGLGFPRQAGPARHLHPLAQPLLLSSRPRGTGSVTATARPSPSPAPARMGTWSPAPWPSSASAPCAARHRAAGRRARRPQARPDGRPRHLLTPDGPRGPRYQLQPGILKLAEATGAPIVPIHVRFHSAWRLKTWDRFVIPKPFSRVEVTFAEPITMSPRIG
jgi:hypothetical protein